MGLLARLFGQKEDDHAAVRPLWAEAVRIARTPEWYARGGIADTVPGRFDALSMVMALILLRMEQSEALRAEPARLTELFVTEMDGTLREQGVALTSGVRGWDMALRLRYDGVEVADVETDLDAALERFLRDHAGEPTRIFCTYTAMMHLRRRLADRFGLARFGEESA